MCFTNSTLIRLKIKYYNMCLLYNDLKTMKVFLLRKRMH